MARASKRIERDHDIALEPSKRVCKISRKLVNPGQWSLEISPRVQKGSQYIQDLDHYNDDDVVIHTKASQEDALVALKHMEYLVEFSDLEQTFLETAQKETLEQMNMLSVQIPEDLRANDVFCLLNPVLGMERSLAMFRSQQSFTARCLEIPKDRWIRVTLEVLDRDTLKRLYDTNWMNLREIIDQTPNWVFSIACENGHLDVAQWLWSLGIRVKLYADIQHVFQMVCGNGHLDVAQWLWSLDDTLNIHYDNEYAFRHACKYGQLDVAKWLWSLDSSVDIHADNEWAFRGACGNGHLDVVKWLWSLDDTIDIHGYDEEAFRHACACGHLEVAQWLWSLDESINIHAHDELIFRWACEHGQLEVAQWLWSLDHSVNIHTHDEYAFRWACENGHLEVAQWLWSLDKSINIHADNGYAFRWTCENGHLDVVQWLETLKV